MVDAGEGCIGWGARDRDLMRGTVHLEFRLLNQLEWANIESVWLKVIKVLGMDLGDFLQGTWCQDVNCFIFQIQATLMYFLNWMDVKLVFAL